MASWLKPLLLSSERVSARYGESADDSDLYLTSLNEDLIESHESSDLQRVKRKRGLTSTRLAAVSLCFGVPLLLYIVLTGTIPFGRPKTQSNAICTASEFDSKGSWQLSSLPIKSMSTDEILAAKFGYKDYCARGHWFSRWQGSCFQKETLRILSAYDWKIQECRVREFTSEMFLEHLMTNGAMMMIGDSLSEEHFSSIAALLCPYITEIEDLAVGHWSIFLHALPQFAEKWNTSLPIIDYIRNDKLNTRQQILDMYPVGTVDENPETVFEHPRELRSQLELFANAENRFGTLLLNTGAHWNSMKFGINGNDSFIATEIYPKMVDATLRLLDKFVRDDQLVILRGTSAAHVNCPAPSKYYGPLSDTLAVDVSDYQYNYQNFPLYNEVWRNAIGKKAHRVTQMGIVKMLEVDRLSGTRPETHMTPHDDCLHLCAGAGILENWTLSLWNILTEI